MHIRITLARAILDPKPEALANDNKADLHLRLEVLGTSEGQKC